MIGALLQRFPLWVRYILFPIFLAIFGIAWVLDGGPWAWLKDQKFRRDVRRRARG